MTSALFSHPEEDGPSLEAPAHDGGEAAASLGGLPRERAMAYAAVERVGPDHPVVALLRKVGRAASEWQGGASLRFDLPALPDADMALLKGVLGHGEVTGRIAGTSPTTFAEAVCPGIWMVREGDADRMEIGDCPACVREAAGRLPMLDRPVSASMPEGVMNVLPVLGELHSHAAAWRYGLPPHGVNLSLLPLSPVDRCVLDDALGEGPVSFESRGYGFARINATGMRHIWRTRFFNSQGTPIQETLDICDVPVGAMATVEDVQDGGARLLAILDIYT